METAVSAMFILAFSSIIFEKGRKISRKISFGSVLYDIDKERIKSRVLRNLFGIVFIGFDIILILQYFQYIKKYGHIEYDKFISISLCFLTMLSISISLFLSSEKVTTKGLILEAGPFHWKDIQEYERIDDTCIQFDVKKYVYFFIPMHPAYKFQSTKEEIETVYRYVEEYISKR